MRIWPWIDFFDVLFGNFAVFPLNAVRRMFLLVLSARQPFCFPPTAKRLLKFQSTPGCQLFYFEPFFFFDFPAWFSLVDTILFFHSQFLPQPPPPHLIVLP